jgi:acyl dehydratase
MVTEDKSLYFEEFKPGDKFFSDERIITEEDIDQFARLSGDNNPIHTDSEFAKTTIYGNRISHGLLVLSLVSVLAASLGFAEKTTIAFRAVDWKFKWPVMAGDSIKAVYEVVGKRMLPIEDGGLIIFKVIVTNQGNQKVQIGKWSLVIKKK